MRTEVCQMPLVSPFHKGPLPQFLRYPHHILSLPSGIVFRGQSPERPLTPLPTVLLDSSLWVP